MAKLVLHTAAHVRLAPRVRAAFLADAAICLAVAAWGGIGLLAGSREPWPWIRLCYGLVALLAALGSAAGRGRAPLWRRRIMWGGALAVLLAGRPEPSIEAGLVVLWHGALVVAQLVAAREVSRATSAVSGEEGLPEV